MTLSELSRLSSKELKRIKRYNSLSYHSFMLASVFFLARAFSTIDPIILLISFGMAVTARAFYSNIKTVEQLRNEKQKA